MVSSDQSSSMIPCPVISTVIAGSLGPNLFGNHFSTVGPSIDLTTASDLSVNPYFCLNLFLVISLLQSAYLSSCRLSVEGAPGHW